MSNQGDEVASFFTRVGLKPIKATLCQRDHSAPVLDNGEWHRPTDMLAVNTRICILDGNGLRCIGFYCWDGFERLVKLRKPCSEPIFILRKQPGAQAGSRASFSEACSAFFAIVHHGVVILGTNCYINPPSAALGSYFYFKRGVPYDDPPPKPEPERFTRLVHDLRESRKIYFIAAIAQYVDYAGDLAQLTDPRYTR